MAPGGSYILRNVDGEIHKGKIEFFYVFKDGHIHDNIGNESELLIAIGYHHQKSEMLKLISQNGHVQLTPKTTPARCLKKEEDFSPKENLLFLLSPFHRATLAKNPSQLAEYLKTDSSTIATHFHSHRTQKYINYTYAISRAKKIAPAPKPECSLM